MRSIYVRGRLIETGDMAHTGVSLLAQEQLFRMGWTAAVVVVLCHPPLGVILYRLLKVVNPLLALLALVFITISTTIEAMNLINYAAPLFVFSLPEYHAAFPPAEIQALARFSLKLFGITFTVSLAFFEVFCGLVVFGVNEAQWRAQASAAVQSS